MFRGTQIDVDDCIVLIESEPMDIESFAQRYRETADYYFNPPACKKTLAYLVTAMDKKGMATAAIKEMMEQWNP